MSRLCGAACALACAAALALPVLPAVARDAGETDAPAARHKADTPAARHKNARHKEKERQDKEHVSKDPFGNIPKGPLQIIISIDQQRLHLYSDGTPVADATIATGVPQHPTPMGVFSVLEKERFHHSNIYSGAPMPFMQRITWSGVALHEGVNLGHPASHGCIRMPGEFAARLFLLHSIGARVVIARPELHPEDFADPHLFVHKDRTPAPAPAAAAPPALEPIRTAQTIDASKTTDVAAPSIPLASDAAAGKAAVKAEEPAGVATPPAPAAAIHAVATDGDPDGNKTAAGDTAVGADPPATAAETSFSAAAEAAAAAVKAAAAEAKAADSSRLPRRENEEGAGKAGDRPTPAVAADTTASTGPAVSAPAAIEPAASQAPAAAATDPVPPAAAATQSSEPAQPAAAAPSGPAQAAAPASDDAARAPREAAPVLVPVPSPKPAAIAQAAAPKATPITIFISRKLKRLYVRQNFAPLFDATIAIDHPEQPLGTHVFTALEYLTDGATLRWNVISLPAQQPRAERAEKQPERADKGRRTHEPLAKPLPEPPAPTPQDALARIDIPPDVIEQISELIVPGSSMIVSDQDLGDETGEGTDFIVVTR